MKKKRIQILKIIAPLFIGVFLIWYSIISATPEERHILWNAILEANLFWVSFSVLIGILSHLSRAYRWNYLLEPLGYKPRFIIRFMALMAGYLANLGIPRSGELLRAATISSYESIPFQKSIGTIITERLIDFIILLFIVLIAFLLNTELLITYFLEQGINPLNFIVFIALFIVISGILYWLIKKCNFPFLSKIRSFLLETYEGMLSVFKMKQKKQFIAHTLFIWTAYIMMFYVVKFSITGIENLPFTSILVAFIAGSFAMTTTNGGIGAFPIAIGLVLLLFNIDKPIGVAYGWILWSSQTLMNLILGGISFMLLPLFSKK